MSTSPEINAPTGQPQDIGQGIRRLLAPNASPMTYHGTNTYLVGTGALAVIDPGPDSEAHLQAILDAVRPGQHISHILVTHAHLDHSPLARRLADDTGAPVVAFGDAAAGRSAVMQELAEGGHVGGGEGVDADFAPDLTVKHGDQIKGDGWQMTAHWTPGHFGNHLSFAMNDTVFCGDLVMGWASSLVSPPDGDLSDFMTSCAHLLTLDAGRLLPGHGDTIDSPNTRINWLMGHRRNRETAILERLRDAPATARTLAEQIYTETPAALLPAAARNVLAHLVDLYGKNTVTPHGTLHAEAQFALRQN